MQHALGTNALPAPNCELRRTRAHSFSKRATLPNGLEVCLQQAGMHAGGRASTLGHALQIECISQADVKFLWNEIFEKQAYLQHGMGVAPGATVLDVGANIGKPGYC